MTTKQTLTRAPLKKEYMGRRSERSKSVLSLREAARYQEFQRMRAQPPQVAAEVPPTEDEPWAKIQVDDIDNAKTEFLNLLNESQTSQIKALSRAKVALMQNPETYLIFAISSSSQILSFLHHHLSINSNPILLQSCLELVTMLACAQAEVVSTLIDSKITAAVHYLLLDWNRIDSSEMRIQILLFFTNLASSSTEMPRLLCVNLELPSMALQLMGSFLAQPDYTEEIAKVCKILSVLLLHMSTTRAEWAEILGDYAPVWIQAMHQLSELAHDVTVNLAFALMDIAQFVDNENMHALVPIFMNQGLMEALMMCSYDERDAIVIAVTSRLLCTTDEYACKYLLSNRSLMETIKNSISSPNSEIRLYAINALSNICGINDANVHDMVLREGYFRKLAAVLHLDNFQIKKCAIVSIGNIFFYGNEDHRDWFCNQRIVLADLMDYLNLRDTKIVADVLDIVASILEHIGGNKEALAWLVFQQLELESKLNEMALASKGELGWSAAKILETHFDYVGVDEDEDVEFEGSEGEEFMVSKSWYPSPGQQPIANYMASTSGRRFAKDQVDIDMCGAGSVDSGICFGNYKF